MSLKLFWKNAFAREQGFVYKFFNLINNVIVTFYNFGNYQKNKKKSSRDEIVVNYN